MTELTMLCPATGRLLSTGIHTDGVTLAKVWFSTLEYVCPHCGQRHLVEVRDAYVEEAVTVTSQQAFRSWPFVV